MHRPRLLVIVVLGIGQVLVWGSTYYLPAVLAKPTAQATGWPLAWVIGGLSLGLLLSGLVSPKVGDLIERRGGRPVLMASAALTAAGLLGLAAAPNLAAYVAAWLVLGVAMGTGLYDPAFAALGRLYGQEARSVITSLTLIAGFASTVCWPLSALLLQYFGWRGTCVAYAALQLAVVLPLYGFGLPREVPRAPAQRHAASDTTGLPRRSNYRLLFWLVALTQTLASIIAAIVSVHLLTVLQLRGVKLDSAVALGALVGPCQVGARLVDLMFGRRIHPVWETMVAAVLVVIGLGLLLQGYGAIWIGLVLYGCGIGLRSIVRGTLPLALFGPGGYASLMGRLAFPMLVAQAAAPSAGAVLLQRYGADGILAALFWLAVATLGTGALLIPFARPRPVPA
ncbi:MAG TPA: MFS transporter [Acetobacteraceae bacterium]|jgi:predicted MFS family arabinose efflux permease